MLILVSDTSILIDLERGGILESVFTCGLQLIVPDLLYERELESVNGPYLQSLGLNVVTLTSDELSFAQAVRNERKTLSWPDCFALSCAMRPKHTLITGDKALRNEGKSRGATVYGLLWLLDQMAASGNVHASVLCDGLSRIKAHPRCRLPLEEVKIRLESWPKKQTAAKNSSTTDTL